MDDRADKKGASPWKWIIAGSVTTLLILAGTAYALLAYAVPQGKTQMARMLEERLGREHDPRIPAERMALLREVSAMANRPSASFASVLLLVDVADDALLDHQVTEQEQANLVLVRDWVGAQKNAAGFSQMGAFITDHPEIKALLNRHTPPLPAVTPGGETTTTQAEK